MNHNTDYLSDANHSIFLIDDELESLRSIEMSLNLGGFKNIKCFSCGMDAIEQLVSETNVDIVLLDLMLPDINGLDLLIKIKEINPDILVIMITGLNEVDMAVQCLKNNALDYIVKPFENERLLTSVRNAMRLRELQKENVSLAEQVLTSELKNPDAFCNIVTNSDKMLSVFKYVEAIAPTNHPVLITGETGVGKELIARSLHALSKRTGPFIAINIAGLDDTLFSDTIFGHVKGAFTGADSVRKGLVESASGGTLFFDEIGDLSLQSQIKLLRLIQEKEYQSIGSDITKLCDARIITATCKSIIALKDSSSFRKDLFYRLRTHHVHISPLRERKEDLEILIQSFLINACENINISMPVIPKELIMLLETYHFPGNIRELQAMVNDALSMHKGNVLSTRSFKEKIGVTLENDEDTLIVNSLQESGHQIQFADQLPTLKEVEDILVSEALKRSKGNQSIACQLLGISRQALGYRLKTRK